ncbi:hypothetical protein KRX56_06185 [Dermabacteraceae bacterium TAE3-ERU27]|nr:hypothetical protein [Dermabacteraceae bacterium TAE3-ERU27]
MTFQELAEWAKECTEHSEGKADQAKEYKDLAEEYTQKAKGEWRATRWADLAESPKQVEYYTEWAERYADWAAGSAAEAEKWVKRAAFLADAAKKAEEEAGNEPPL